MELQLKHLAPYLPYQLKMIFEAKGGRIITLSSITNSEIGTIISGGYGGMYLDSCGFNPILRNLSDLTKEIEVNGEKFVPFERIAIYSSVEYLIDQIQSGLVEVIVYNMLVAWHFDVHNLITSDLAIDANTLNQK